MIICDHQNKVYLRWRDSDGNRVSETIEDYKPYFYIDVDSDMPEVFDFKSSYGVKRVRPTYDFTDTFSEWKNIKGEPLVKVILNGTKQVYDVRKKWDKTYEADISLSRKYCVDRMDSIKEYDLRKWYLDIETQVGGRWDDAINAITIYDNYDEEYFTLSWWPFEPIPSIKNVLIFEDEEEMLSRFIELVEEKDPDMFVGWYINGFDIPTLIKRIVKNGLNPRRLSPVNDIKGASHNRVFNANYNNTAQPIKGRISYCLMSTFERLWLDSQRGTLPSLSLDYCSKLVLGESAGKVKDSKFKDEEFFKRAWLEDTNIFLEYNRVDVELMVRMDKEMNISENSLALQRLLICPLDVTFHNTQMAASYFMRYANWKAPTGVKGDKQKYEAAFVMNPLTENTYGLHKNIAVFDFKSLYPSMMVSRNICWATKDTINRNTKSLEVNVIDFTVPKNLSEWEKERVDVVYVKEPMGVLPNAVISLMKLRDGYKEARSNASNAEEYRKWDSAQMATKRVVNAFYGVLAKDGYGWGDMDMAASITASAREAMRAVAFKAIEYGYEVIYGHTDSIFVKVEGVDDAKQLCIKLNEYIKNDVFDEYVELEFEKLAETFFLSKKKNRYCGYLSWKDGKYLDESEFFVMGFEMKKSNETQLAKGFQKQILQMVCMGNNETEITSHARKLYLQITGGEIPSSKIIKRSRLKKSLDKYKAIGGGVAGIYYYNNYLDLEPIEVGDSYYFYVIDNSKIFNYPNRIRVGDKYRTVEYMACKKVEDVIDKFPPNWNKIAESEIIKKVSLIYDSMGWDLEAISRNGIQKKLEEWW